MEGSRGKCCVICQYFIIIATPCEISIFQVDSMKLRDLLLKCVASIAAAKSTSTHMTSLLTQLRKHRDHCQHAYADSIPQVICNSARFSLIWCWKLYSTFMIVVFFIFNCNRFTLVEYSNVYSFCQGEEGHRKLI